MGWQQDEKEHDNVVDNSLLYFFFRSAVYMKRGSHNSYEMPQRRWEENIKDEAFDVMKCSNIDRQKS